MLQKLLGSLLVFVMLFGGPAFAVDAAEPKGNVAQAETDVDNDDDNDDDEELDVDEELPESPLALVGGEEKSLGELTEASVVEFEVEAENKGEEEVFFKRAMSTCACLKILESPDAQKLAPGARIKVRAQLIGHRLGHQKKNWKRWIYLETKGFSQAALTVSGTFRPLMVISPDATMYLGDFEGSDIPWVRTITISAAAPEKCPNLTVLPPQESKRFDLKLTLTDEKARKFELEIRPKLPMTPGRFGELVFLPVPLLGKDMGIRLRLFGKVLGRRFILSNKAFRLTEADFEKDTAVKRTLKVALKDTEFRQAEVSGPSEVARLLNKGVTHHDHKDKAKGTFYVNHEEQAARAVRPADYKEKVLEKIELTSEGVVAIEREAKGDMLEFTLTVSPEILKLPEKKVTLELKLNGKVQRTIDVYVSDKARVEKRRGIRRNAE